MPFKKGESGNWKGKKAGTMNLTTLEAKAILTGILDRHLTAAKINKDLAQLDAKQRLDVLCKIAAFIVPRPTESSLEITSGGKELFPEITVEIIDRRDQVDPEYLKGQ